MTFIMKHKGGREGMNAIYSERHGEGCSYKLLRLTALTFFILIDPINHSCHQFNRYQTKWIYNLCSKKDSLYNNCPRNLLTPNETSKLNWWRQIVNIIKLIAILIYWGTNVSEMIFKWYQIYTLYQFLLLQNRLPSYVITHQSFTISHWCVIEDFNRVNISWRTFCKAKASELLENVEEILDVFMIIIWLEDLSGQIG